MRLFGIIGYPLGHSFSQQHFSDKFRKENLSDCCYCKFELPSIDLLPSLIGKEKDLCGFNVTIPYKTEVLKYLHEIDGEAAEIGAVNTVRVSHRGGKPVLKGYNTDAPAFRESLLNNLATLPETALVLGTGGASKSVNYTLIDLNIRTIPVSRKKIKGGYSYEDLPSDLLSEAGLIVNTTPLGMAPVTDASPPLDYSMLREGQLLFDLIYNPPVTQFLQRGEEHGCHIVNGEEMFIIQADLSWKIWNSNFR